MNLLFIGRLLLTGAFFVFAPFCCLQERVYALTLTELISDLDSTSPMMANIRVESASAKSDYTSSRAFPNPSLFIERESLNDFSKTAETVIGVRQDLGFLWSYQAHRAAQKSVYESSLANYSEFKNSLAATLINKLYEYDALKLQSSALDCVIIKTERLAEVVSLRHSLGDIALYDKQRLLLELTQLQSNQQELFHNKQIIMTELVALSGVSSSELEAIILIDPVEPVLANKDEAMDETRKRRSKIRQIELETKSAKHALNAAALSQLPDLSVSLGSKSVDPGANGGVFTVEIGIPIWRQRRSEKQLAQAKFDRMKIVNRAEQELIAQEVESAYRQLELIKHTQQMSWSEVSQRATDNMMRGIQLYTEGEITAFELADALRTNLNAQESALKLRNSLIAAIVELRRAIGLTILE